MASQGTAEASAIDVPQISRDEMRRRVGDSALTILDVLPDASYVQAHIPGAINLPLEEVTGHARELLPDLAADIAVYCGKFT